MSSPIKTKDKKKEPVETKKKQLLKIFHQTIPFLQIFTPDEIDYLQDKLHIFVFNKGQILAKENEHIDYLGVIAEGRAVSKNKNYQIGDTIGGSQVLGYHQQHLQSIVGQSDGIIIAIRIYDLTFISNNSIGNKIVSFISGLYVKELIKRQDISKQINQFETIQDKKVSKYLTPEWSSFYSELDLRQKSKFTSYFPFYKIKQKEMVMNGSLRPSLLYVVQGQVVAKSKMEQNIIQAGKMFNTEGFLLKQQIKQNVYCLSSEAVILVIDKQLLENNFKAETFNEIVKISLKDLDSKYKKDSQDRQEKEEKQVDTWSIFKKHPNRQILPLPKKVNNQHPHPKMSKSNSQADKQKLPFAALQTLFKEQLGMAQGKVKTVSSVAESNYGRLLSLKSEPKEKLSFSEGQLEKLRKQVEILTQKLKFAEEMSHGSRLDLIENKSKLNMNQVFKQIRKLHQQEQGIHKIKVTEGKMSQNLLTFKQAFDKQIKQNRIQQVVAKCAFKWLYLTRKNKANKKQ